MSLDWQFGEAVIVCDGKKCSEFVETGEREFKPAIEQIKRAGWKIRKEGGEWVHYCPMCADEHD